MSRLIKFRAWDNKEKEFVKEYDTGNYSTYMQLFGDKGWSVFSKELVCHCCPEGCGGCEDDWVEVKEATLMQFTGRLDTKGKEIYEKDICRILYTDWPSQSAENNGRYSMSLEDYKKSISSIMVVKFFSPSFWLCRSNDACSNMDPGKHGEIEIIGNIYENPGLLNKAT